MKRTFLWAALLLNGTAPALACTGISFTARDGAFVTARTIEWGESPLPSGYVVIPRQHETVSYTPTGANGLSFRAKYGAVGLTIVREEFIAEGINEAGLSAGLFYFPHYGKYPAYDSTRERPDALGSPVCRVDTLAILLRRRSQSRHTDRTGRIDRSLRRLDRPLAHRGRDRQAGRAGVHRRRAPLLRQRSRRADELARLSVADNQSEQLRESASGKRRSATDRKRPGYSPSAQAPDFWVSRETSPRPLVSSGSRSTKRPPRHAGRDSMRYCRASIF